MLEMANEEKQQKNEYPIRRIGDQFIRTRPNEIHSSGKQSKHAIEWREWKKKKHIDAKDLDAQLTAVQLK